MGEPIIPQSPRRQVGNNTYVTVPGPVPIIKAKKDMPEPIDCRSEVGVTVGLIDALISIARIVAKRDLKNPAVEEALLDFLDDNDLLAIRAAALQVEVKRDWDGP